MNIVVLAGGTSTERDVSIVTGTNVCKALREKKHRAVLVDLFGGLEELDIENAFPEDYSVDDAAAYLRSFNDRLDDLKKTRRGLIGPNVIEICKLADIVFLGLHGSNGEDGRLQAMFDLLGIPYTGTGALGSAMAMDKGITKQIFLMNGIPTPNGRSMKKGEEIRNLKDISMDFPVVVKTCCGGSSIGVYIVENQAAYEKALDEAFTYEDEVVVETCISGVEYTAAVVDGEAYPVVEIVPLEGFYDYENKYKPGAVRETCPAPISEELTKRIQEYAVKGFYALRLEGYARLDFIVTAQEEIYCLEANTLPGMTPTSLIPQEAAAIGIGYPELCEKLIAVSMKKYENGR